MFNDQGSNTKINSVGAKFISPDTKELFISVRSRDGKNIGEKTLYEFISELNQQIEKRT